MSEASSVHTTPLPWQTCVDNNQIFKMINSQVAEQDVVPVVYLAI